MDDFVLKGDICYSDGPDSLRTIENGYVVCEGGICRGAFEKLPEEYESLPLEDFTGKIVFPGLIDLHIHAPQFAFRGTGMDLELLDWLNTYTFPEEKKYADRDYAEKAYTLFADAMKKSATTRASIFATQHIEATEILMDKMEKTGLITLVGKVNMDRESIPGLQELGPMDSAFKTFGWINKICRKYERTRPILTPRFIPSCSDELMNELREIQKAYGLPVQSHLSENPGEVEWVKSLCPDTECYGDAYDKWGLFGGDVPTVMAHCIYSGDKETELMRKRGVFIAHCPTSNINLSSGIAPIRKYMELGMNIGLGSDVAGGHSESMMLAVRDAIRVSKLYWRMVDDTKAPLTFAEAFSLATLGGGAFFGKVGSFGDGYEFDAVVLDDSGVPAPFEMSVENRMERAVYLSLDMNGLAAKYVAGTRIF